MSKFGELYLADEIKVVKMLLESIDYEHIDQRAIHAKAQNLLTDMRQHIAAQAAVDKIIHAFPLNSREGLALMTLAEALLRIPDSKTAQELISDKIHEGGWKAEGHSYERLTQITSGLMRFAGYFLEDVDEGKVAHFLKKLLQPVSGPLIHKLTVAAIRKLNSRFVLGETIEQALTAAKKTTDPQLTFSFDMLGEAALTHSDAEKYFEKYENTIEKVGQNYGHVSDIQQKPSVSIKLSGLHPRYEFSQRERVLKELGDKLHRLCLKAKEQNISIAIDAEESYRLSLSLELYEDLLSHSDLKDWEGCGFVIQAYQKRATAVVQHLCDLAMQKKRYLPVRLVKGAYWDSEIKWAQQAGLESYPVFTQKVTTDVSYLVCAQQLFSCEWIYPQFATHNPLTVATILHIARDKPYELQRLQGMGEELTTALREQGHDVKMRVYAPVGAHQDLLPYLVRRLLENGANTSFVHQIHDPHLSDEQILQDPVEILLQQTNPTNHLLPLPRYIYGSQRMNAKGFHISDPEFISSVQEAIQGFKPMKLTTATNSKTIVNPADGKEIGRLPVLDKNALTKAFISAQESFASWSQVPITTRADMMRQFGDKIESHLFEYMAIIIYEAGKTYDDALAEVREAIDFCRYYAHHAEAMFAHPHVLKGPTGEENILSWHPRGVFMCISPWNFPLAIFIGQVVAALVSGNTVLAKPASGTPFIAYKAIKHLHEIGVPQKVVQLIIADNKDLEEIILSSPQLAGIAFTGSTETARHLVHQTLKHKGPLVPIIAETGGQNGMIVDSSALPEQVVPDIIRSAFKSAGQRCSALRVLFLQNEVADSLIQLLKEAAAELVIGDPREYTTDIGPVISAQAKSELESHKEYLKRKGKLIYEGLLPKEMKGHFVSPAIYEIPDLSILSKEVFGPILHIIRYNIANLEEVLQIINNTGYGLTMGLHSRLPRRIAAISKSSKVGNLYVNRDMIGAVVGVQPFGGEGLSGTGFKAGGPNYLKRFAVERVRTVNLTAQGGNVTLLTQNNL